MYQFIHVESYSKISAKKKLNYNNETKGRNVSDIIGEVTRKKGYCDHVEQPEPPKVLYGVNPEELEALTDDYFNNTKLTNSKGVTRGLRKDSHILLAGVVSLNRECEGFWEDYKKDSIQWLKEKYGDKLKCVVEHTDEEHPHLHFYCIQNPGEDFNLLHEGKRAFQAEDKKYKKEIAFKEAMRDFQEDFYKKVSLPYGLMKTGPKRQRLSNSDYKRQQQEVRLINLFKEKTTEEMSLLINETEKEIKKQKEKSEKEIFSLKENAIALGQRIGKSRGFKEAIKNFSEMSYFRKAIFSKTFSDKMIADLEKNNNELKKENKSLRLRKNHYKKLHLKNDDFQKKYEQEKKDNEYYKKLNYITENITNEKKENEDDIRRRIVEALNHTERQQREIDRKCEKIGQRNTRNRARIADFTSAIGRIRRVLSHNIKAVVEYFISNEFIKKRSKNTEKRDEKENHKVEIEPKENKRSIRKRKSNKI